MRDPRTARRPHRPGNRWELIWSHRDELLEIARRRSPSAEDAEDAVQEAMIRAVEDQGVQHGRVGPWLRTATVRLCADRQRQVARDSELSSSTAITPAEAVPVEETACDRAEARWLADRSAYLLPTRQAEALRLRSQDLDVAQVARHMGLSYRAAESLLARARRALRGVLAGSLSVAVTVWLFARRFPRTGFAQAAAATSTAATVAVVGLALPAGPPALPDSRSPGYSQGATAPRPAPVAADPAPRRAPGAPARRLSPDPRRLERTGEATPAAISKKPPKNYELPGAAAVTETIAPGASVPARPSTAAPTPTSIPALPLDASGAPFPKAPSVPSTTVTTRTAEALHLP